MKTTDLIALLAVEYHGYLGAHRVTMEQHNLEIEPLTWYEFLVVRGFNRHQLSALGISKGDVP